MGPRGTLQRNHLPFGMNSGEAESAILAQSTQEVCGWGEVGFLSIFPRNTSARGWAVGLESRSPDWLACLASDAPSCPGLTLRCSTRGYWAEAMLVNPSVRPGLLSLWKGHWERASRKTKMHKKFEEHSFQAFSKRKKAKEEGLELSVGWASLGGLFSPMESLCPACTECTWVLELFSR